MARYLETAAKANNVAQKVMDFVPESDRPHVACLLSQLVNLGFRCNPRAAQSTIRYNAVRAAMHGLPVKVSMTQVQSARGTFNALSAEPVGVVNPEPIIEGNDSDDVE